MKQLHNIAPIKMDKVEIIPVDQHIAVRANGLKLLNQFKSLGFTKRSAFVGVVQDIDKDYLTIENEKKLLSFWDARLSCTWLNNDLECVIEKLKAS